MPENKMLEHSFEGRQPIQSESAMINGADCGEVIGVDKDFHI